MPLLLQIVGLLQQPVNIEQILFLLVVFYQHLDIVLTLHPIIKLLLSNLVPQFQPGTTQRIRVNMKDRTTSLKSVTGSSTAANNLCC